MSVSTIERQADASVEVRIAALSSRGVEVRAYTSILNEVLLSLEEIDRLAVESRTPRLRWAVSSLSAEPDLIAQLRPITLPVRRQPSSLSLSPEGLVAGVAQLGEAAEIPTLFSARTVERVQAIGRAIGHRGVAEVSLASVNGHRNEGVVDETTLRNAKAAVRPAQSAWSSVVGRLDVLEARRRDRPKAQVYDARTRRAVILTAHEDQTDVLQTAFGHQVMASGVLIRNSSGQAVRLDLMELQIIQHQDSPPSARDLLGLAPEITGDVSTLEYVRGLERG